MVWVKAWVWKLEGVRTGLGGPGSSVGIATYYGLDGPGSNPGGDEIFSPSRPALGPPGLLYNGYRVFFGGRGGRAVGLTPHPI